MPCKHLGHSPIDHFEHKLLHFSEGLMNLGEMRNRVKSDLWGQLLVAWILQPSPIFIAQDETSLASLTHVLQHIYKLQCVWPRALFVPQVALIMSRGRRNSLYPSLHSALVKLFSLLCLNLPHSQDKMGKERKEKLFTSYRSFRRWTVGLYVVQFLFHWLAAQEELCHSFLKDIRCFRLHQIYFFFSSDLLNK